MVWGTKSVGHVDLVSVIPSSSDHMENINGYLMKYTNLVTGWQYR